MSVKKTATLIVSFLGLVAASACVAPRGEGSTLLQTEPAIFTADYRASDRLLLIELCRVAVNGSIDGPQDCHLVQADLSGVSEGEVVTPTVVAAEEGFMYSQPVFSPSGDAVYAIRRRSLDWENLTFRAPCDIVRIDLATGEIETIISGPVNLAVVAALADGTADQLVLFEPLSFNSRNIPVGSRVSTVRVDNGRAVEGSRHVFEDLGGRAFDLTISGVGFVKGAVERNGSLERREGYMALRGDDLAQGRYVVRPDLISATAYAVGCEADACIALVARRAHATAAAIAAHPVHDTSRLQNVETTPEDVVGAFNGRPTSYFRDDRDPYGSYRLNYDLTGGAVASPRGPQVDPSRVPFTIMGGDDIPFGPVASGYLNLAAYADGRL